MLPGQEVLAVVALLLAASPATAPTHFAWPTPNAIEAVDVPGVVWSNGIPMKLHAVRVRHHPQEMVDIYMAAFRKAGFYIPPPKHQIEVTRELMLTAFDPARFISYSVIFQPNPDGTTTLILGEANLNLAKKPQVSFAPLYPGAAHPMHAHFEGAEVETYDTAAAPDAIEAFYRKTLPRDGFRALKSGAFQRGGERIRLSVTADAKTKRSHVTLIRALVAPSASAAPPPATPKSAPGSNP